MDQACWNALNLSEMRLAFAVKGDSNRAREVAEAKADDEISPPVMIRGKGKISKLFINL